MTCQNKINNHFFSFKNQNNLHNYWFARKFPPCTFIDLPENFPPARLFRPARLMFSKNFPTCTFISSYTSIRYTRVCKSCIRLEIAPIYIGRVKVFLNKVVFAEYISMHPSKELCTGSAKSNWCISDEHFFMIRWHYDKKEDIFWNPQIGRFDIKHPHLKVINLVYFTSLPHCTVLSEFTLLA